MKENAVTNYLKGALEELTKVTWPTRNQAINLTIIVLVFCLIAAVFLGLVDLGFNELYTYLLKISQ